MRIIMPFTYAQLSERGSERYNNKYTYVPYEGTINTSDVFTYICPLHGEQKTTIKKHFKKNAQTGCVPCGRLLAIKNATKSLEQFKIDVKEKHGDKYDLTNFVYVNKYTKGPVKCNDCGNTLEVHPNFLLNSEPGNGCRFCKKCSIYTTNYYKKHGLENHECTLYVVKFIERETKESFLKLGITKHPNVRKRFRGLHKKFDITILHKEDKDFSALYEKEQELLKELKSYKYEPKNKIKGHTECLKIEIWDFLQSCL